ncbi:hypothetical protein Esti_000957 [Eimeria stiedai]
MGRSWGPPELGGPEGPRMSPVGALFLLHDKAVRSLEEELRGAETYEDYLDSFITDNERMYLKNEELSRQLVEIGCLKGAVLSKESFYAKAEALDQQQKAAKRGGGGAERYVSWVGGGPSQLATGSSLAKQLSAREELIRCGSLSTIAFVRDRNDKGHEVSGYIDLADRLKTNEYQAVIAGTKKLLPRPGDLSYFNWDTGRCVCRDSSDFLVVNEENEGLLFKHRRDRKLLDPDPKAYPGDNSKRTDVATPELQHVVLLDHTSSDSSSKGREEQQTETNPLRLSLFQQTKMHALIKASLQQKLFAASARIH